MSRQRVFGLCKQAGRNARWVLLCVSCNLDRWDVKLCSAAIRTRQSVILMARHVYIISATTQSKSLIVPAEVDSFLGQLPRSVLGVIIWLIPHHLHPLSPTTLLTAVLTDHVQLPNPVLEPEERFRMRFMVERTGMAWREKREREREKCGEKMVSTKQKSPSSSSC